MSSISASEILRPIGIELNEIIDGKLSELTVTDKNISVK
jgi:hypothetical protein